MTTTRLNYLWSSIIVRPLCRYYAVLMGCEAATMARRSIPIVCCDDQFWRGLNEVRPHKTTQDISVRSTMCLALCQLGWRGYFSCHHVKVKIVRNHVELSQIARFMGPTWGPPGSCRPQVGPICWPHKPCDQGSHTKYHSSAETAALLLSGVPDLFDRNKILSGGDLSHYQVPHCIRGFFYFVWFVLIHHNFQFYFELCTYCNILDIYLS